MRIHDKDFCQRVLTLSEESINPDPDLITLRMPRSSNINVHHVNTSDGGFPLVRSLNIFVLLSGNSRQNTSAFGKSGWNEQEQCIVWIPLQRGVSNAKRACSYSVAVVMNWKTGESSSNGAPPKVDTHFRHD